MDIADLYLIKAKYLARSFSEPHQVKLIQLQQGFRMIYWW